MILLQLFKKQYCGRVLKGESFRLVLNTDGSISTIYGKHMEIYQVCCGRPFIHTLKFTPVRKVTQYFPYSTEGGLCNYTKISRLYVWFLVLNKIEYKV